MRGSSPMAEPGSHACDIGPCGEGVQVKHGPAPAVDGQCNTEDADDVHDYSCPGLLERKRIVILEQVGHIGKYLLS